MKQEIEDFAQVTDNIDPSLKAVSIHRHGKDYHGVYDRMCNQGGYESKAWRWFIWDQCEYIGDFASVVEAERYLDTI